MEPHPKPVITILYTLLTLVNRRFVARIGAVLYLSMTMMGRKKDKKLLAKVASRGCVNHPDAKADPAHIISRGAGGDDVETNVMSLCRECHTTQHQLGWKRFSDKHPFVKIKLRSLGWKFNQYNKLERIEEEPK